MVRGVRCQLRQSDLRDKGLAIAIAPCSALGAFFYALPRVAPATAGPLADTPSPSPSPIGYDGAPVEPTRQPYRLALRTPRQGDISMVEPMSTTDTTTLPGVPHLRVVRPADAPLEDGALQTHGRLARFDLELGGRLDNVTLAYRTWGKLNPAGDNAVIILHALTGDSLAAGDGGWWEPVVGRGRPIDTDSLFVVCANVLGGCSGSTGPSVDRPGHRPTVCDGVPADHHWRHRRHPAPPGRTPRCYQPDRGWRLDRRLPGARLGDPPRRPRSRHDRDRGRRGR